MVRITLPDNSVKEFEGTTTGTTVAQSIGARLAEAALAVEVNGKPQDLDTPITSDATLKIATVKDALGLDTMRHTTAAQLLARAIKELYPGAQLAIGPTIDSGFYYDVAFPTPLSSDDLPKIEAKMQEIRDTHRKVVRELWDPEQLKKHFQHTGDTFKCLIIDDAVAKGELIDGKVSAYRQVGSRDAALANEDFIDLCRGPHVPSLDKITGAFKLTNIAGAYWKGDSQNQQLTRIYGIMFATQKELDAYLLQREEAEKRDHRKIGPALDLFHLQDEAPGQAFWHPKGWSLYLELEHFIRGQLRKYDYREVNTPRMVHKRLYEQSGHWQNYSENLFLICDEATTPLITIEGKQATDKPSSEWDIYSLKPMNCPCHVQIFNHGIRSYRDLPLRMSEFGVCARNEAKGALHGLMRVTTLTQDDAHIFCTPEQIESEVTDLCKLIAEVYDVMGFHDYFVLLATRPEKRVGEDSLWDAAEKSLQETCEKAGTKVEIAPGEGAFYGPKLEFHLRDAIGRSWQCGTVQLDFNLPRRMGALYTNEQGERVPAVMIHRAVLGSLERFIGILIEHHEGKFPTWLAPEQAVIIPITDGQNAYAEEVKAKLMAMPVANATQGLRVEVDASGERMQKKILFAQQRKVPYMLVVGKKEAEEGTVSVRLRDGTDLGAKPLAWFADRLKQETESRKDTPTPTAQAAA